jgi:hypothetical protein
MVICTCFKVLDQAAREVAGVYSQRRQIDGKQEDEATVARREELIKSILATQEEAMAVLRRKKERNTQVYDGEMPVRDE